MRHASESPHPRDAMRESLRQDPHEYPFVNQSFVSAGDHNSSPYMLPNSGGKAPKGAGTTRSYGYRARGGPKRPPNAYMMYAHPHPPTSAPANHPHNSFCERERDAVRERESMKENFDMHKALAQAWRDLKHEGQKPYFDEYEKNKASYTAKVNELRDFHGGQQQEPSSAGGGGKRAASQGSAPGSPVGAGTSADEEGEDHVMAGGDYGFTSVNRN